MKNSELAIQLTQQLNAVHEANERYKVLQRKAYVVTTNCQSNGTAQFMLHPNFIEKSGTGHSEIPAGGGKSEVWEAFSGMPLSVLDGILNDQYETDPTICQKLAAGLEKVRRVLDEIDKLYEKTSKTERYYSEMWEGKTRQWDHEAKLKEIWNNNPGLPLFGASEILAGRDPWDNEWSKSSSPRGGSSQPSRKASDSGYDEAPWAWQAEFDAIEARNYRVWKAGLHDYYHGKNSPRYACVKPK